MDMTLPPPSGPAAISGVVVRSRHEDLAAVAARLAHLPGIDVHHLEEATGRVIITLETESSDQEEARMESVRRDPGVLSAELVYHYVDPQGAV
jgi:nitrate reductase NapD